MSEETTPQENNDPATEEGEGEAEIEAKTNAGYSSHPQPWPMANVSQQAAEEEERGAQRIQTPAIAAEEAPTEEADEENHTEGVRQTREDELLTVTGEALATPRTFNTCSCST